MSDEQTPKRLTPEELERIQKLVNDLQVPGPWACTNVGEKENCWMIGFCVWNDADRRDICAGFVNNEDVLPIEPVCEMIQEHPTDVLFITESATTIPALLSHLAAVEAEIEEWRKNIGMLGKTCERRDQENTELRAENERLRKIENDHRLLIASLRDDHPDPLSFGKD